MAESVQWIGNEHAIHRWWSNSNWFNVWFYGFRPESGPRGRKRVPQPISGGHPLPDLEAAKQFVEFHRVKLADMTRVHGKYPSPDALGQFERDLREWLVARAS